MPGAAPFGGGGKKALAKAPVQTIKTVIRFFGQHTIAALIIRIAQSHAFDLLSGMFGQGQVAKSLRPELHEIRSDAITHGVEKQ